jgi:Zn-finger nucleic acid-binding protein
MTIQPLAMPCPKCAVPMRSLERSGLHIEICPDCRGVFLDRGELDRLIDIEADAGSRPAAAGGDRARIREWASDDDDDGLGEGSARHGTSRRRGFLGELFEGFGD